MNNKVKIKKGDEVIVIAGKNKGKLEKFYLFFLKYIKLKFLVLIYQKDIQNQILTKIKRVE